MTQKTTVLHIITKLELGGAQKVALALLDGLNKGDSQAFLLSGTSGTLAPELKENKNVVLIDTLKREVTIKNFLWLEIKNFFVLTRMIRTYKKDNPNLVVHTHSTKAGFIGRWAAFFAGVKKRVHTIHGHSFNDHQPWIVRSTIIFLEWVTSLITTHYVCVSSKDAQTGIKFFPAFNKKHSIIRAAIDSEKFFIPAQRTSMPDDDAENLPKQYIFGTIGCFKPQKNLIDLIQAFQFVHINNPQARLEIIGDGIMRPQIETKIKQLNLEKHVTLLGWQKNVAPFMNSWDAFVMSSLWEGLPCSVVEARMLKLPVLAYDTGGISDVITHGKNGFLYPQNSWLSLGQGMLNISKDNMLHSSIKQYKDDLSDFHYDAMVSQHVKLYKSL